MAAWAGAPTRAVQISEGLHAERDALVGALRQFALRRRRVVVLRYVVDLSEQ